MSWSSCAAERYPAGLARYQRGITDLDVRYCAVDSRGVGIAVLGPLTIEGEREHLGRRDRVVLAALVVHPGDVVSAEVLADVLWGEQLPASWSKVVQGCVVRLRKALGSNSIETSSLGYKLTVPRDEIDTQRFERTVVRATNLLAAGDAERSALLLADALTLWRGKPLTDVEGWESARIESARLEELRQRAEELYVEASLRSGRHESVLAKARALTSEAPLRERRWALLATAQYQCGRQADALKTLRELRVVLNRELGLDPGQEIGLLEQAILRQDPSLVVASTLPEPSTECPYLGLKPYDLDDAEVFFGRDAEVAAGLRKLADNSVLAVVGPSGCGKSSLVRAGIAARLRSGGRRVVVMTPGVHPLAALADALPGDVVPAALVVDQCEEVFSLCADAAEREAFLDRLTAHRAEAPLILSYRADRLAEIAAYPGFAHLVEQGLQLLTGMSETDLRTAITEPARLASLVVEPGLVDLLVREVDGQPGALPLMSHALAETWQRREGRTLTVDGYRASGGIEGAVAQSAEEIYTRLRPEQQARLRELLLRLVTPGPDGQPIRGRLPRRLVVTGPESDALIDLLVGSRLVTSDDGVVELAHEAVARAWPRLRRWLDDDLEGQQILHHLTIAADSWNSLGRPHSELYRGVRLAKALDWREGATVALTEIESDFLAAGQHLSEAELRAVENQARYQVRVNRRLRGALAAAALLLAGALIAGVVAVRQAEQADQQAAAAEQAAVRELARRVGARALLTEGISHSLLLAAQGVRLEDSPETRTNLLAALNKRPLLVRSLPAVDGDLGAFSFSPDGTRVVAGGKNAACNLYETESGRPVATYSFVPDPETQLSGNVGGVGVVGSRVFCSPLFTPDGRYVAAMTNYTREYPEGQRAMGVRLLTPNALEVVPLAFPTQQNLLYRNLVSSADAQHLAASVRVIPQLEEMSIDAPGFALVWDLRARGRRPHKVTLPPGPHGLALSPDGDTIYTQQPLAAYDVATGKVHWRRDGPSLVGSRAQIAIDLTRDGNLLALQPIGATDQGIALVDAHTGKTVRMLRGHTGVLRDVAFSRDGTLLGSASQDGEVIVWDVATGTPRERIRTFEISWAVGFSPDNRTLYTGGDEGMLRAYDRSGQQLYLSRRQPMPARDYLHALASADGNRTAYVWRDTTDSWLSFADAATGATTAPVRVHGEVEQSSRTPASWHPDGRRLAVFDTGGTVTVLDAQTGKVVVRRKVVEPGIWSIAYVDGGDRILVSDSRNQTTFFDARTLQPSGVPLNLTNNCCTAASPDKETAVVFDDSPDGAEEHWRVIRTATGDVLSEGDLNLRINHAAYSPDSRRFAAIGSKGEVVIIDVPSGDLHSAPATGHSGAGRFVRFSEDGSRLVSGAEDGTLSLWDARNLELLGTVATSAGTKKAAISPSFSEGRDVVTVAAFDGRTYRWDTRIGSTLDFACTMAGRNLTDEEWRQAFGERLYQKTCPDFG
ncbi:WD40 repeat protein [Kribbella steppae]|uniref:WD40 repeat protein n=1 Tax=Kribbella steppae TaxID=2512223 RepID=A0A4R2H5S1_9ACTN|nr:BTAD domain-containing putative transcriptional regulator [Kribbella steppae]TCO21347.1 WD40 repeat protein [Kribbella steppae]